MPGTATERGVDLRAELLSLWRATAQPGDTPVALYRPRRPGKLG
jgi:hypothetical protein